MPMMIVLAVVVAVYSVTRPGAVEGIKYFLIPNSGTFLHNDSCGSHRRMFILFPSPWESCILWLFIGKEVDVEKSTTQVEVFDTGVALLAGLMIIPSVFAFSDGDMETLQAGPSLTFITLPKVFSSMGVGTVVGIVFFLMFLFAALTSAISLAGDKRIHTGR